MYILQLLTTRKTTKCMIAWNQAPFKMRGLEAAVGPPPLQHALWQKHSGPGGGGEVNGPTSDQHTRLCGVPSRYRHRVSTCASPRADRTGEGAVSWEGDHRGGGNEQSVSNSAAFKRGEKNPKGKSFDLGNSTGGVFYS